MNPTRKDRFEERFLEKTINSSFPNRLNIGSGYQLELINSIALPNPSDFDFGFFATIEGEAKGHFICPVNLSRGVETTKTRDITEIQSVIQEAFNIIVGNFCTNLSNNDTLYITIDQIKVFTRKDQKLALKMLSSCQSSSLYILKSQVTKIYLPLAYNLFFPSVSEV